MEIIRSIAFFLILSTLANQLVTGTKYRPYVNLVAGFMLLSLMVKPLMAWMSGGEAVQETFENFSKASEPLSFGEEAKAARISQLEKEIKTILEKQKMIVKEVSVQIDDDGNVTEIQVKAENQKETRKLIKTILLNFYNVKESNINISE